jgi:hypothetical protein
MKRLILVLFLIANNTNYPFAGCNSKTTEADCKQCCGSTQGYYWSTAPSGSNPHTCYCCTGTPGCKDAPTL